MKRDCLQWSVSCFQRSPNRHNFSNTRPNHINTRQKYAPSCYYHVMNISAQNELDSALLFPKQSTFYPFTLLGKDNSLTTYWRPCRLELLRLQLVSSLILYVWCSFLHHSFTAWVLPHNLCCDVVGLSCCRELDPPFVWVNCVFRSGKNLRPKELMEFWRLTVFVSH